MEELKAASLALAREALVPPNEFQPSSKRLTDSLERVLVILKSVPAESITANVAEYVYFPLHSLLQQAELGTRPTELLLRILSILLSTAWRNRAVFDLQKAQQLVAVTTFLLSPEPPSLTQSSQLQPSRAFLESSTSLHAAGFQCLNALFTSAAVCGFGPDLGQAPTMAHIISILLNAIQYDAADVESQRQSILTLSTILHDIVVNRDHRALILPRIASKLAKFVAPVNRKHFTAKTAAISCLNELIVGSMSDASFQTRTKSTIRTEDWIKKTSEHLNETFKVLRNLLVAVQSNQSARPELIESLYDFSSTVFSQCLEVLQTASKSCIDVLLEMLILCASQKVNLVVAKKADAFIRHSEIVPKQLETGMVRQIQSLPAVLDSPGEERALLLLRSLQKSVQYVDSSDAREAVLDSIVDALPLSVVKNSNSVSLSKQVQTISSFNPRQNSMIHLSDLGLSLPLTATTQDLVCQVVSEAGRKNGAPTVERLCASLEALRTRGRGSLDSTLTLWCLACIIRTSPSESDLYDVVAYCYEDIANSMNILSTSSSDASPAVYAHTALCCYVLGEVALNQGHSFDEHLVDLLHPIFCMLGDSESMHIRREAQLAISKIAYACGYDSSAQLALANKDYLVDGISTQLNTLNFTPGTPSALAALIYVSGSSIIPYLDDVFSSLFVLLDHYHGYTTLVKSILVVFSALTSVIDKSIARPQASLAHLRDKREFISTFEDLLTELDRKPDVDPSVLEKEVDLSEPLEEKIKEVSNDETTKDSDDEESCESDDEENVPQDVADQATEKWHSPIAKSIYLTLERIVGYCDRLMTHDSPEVRLAVLSLFTRLTPFLALNNEHFLPLVHKTWPEAISRVFDSEIYIVEESLGCLSAITSYAGEFVSARIDTLWPKLAESFGNLFKRSWPQFSAERRTESALVNFLVAVIESLPHVSLVTLDSMMRVLRPALLRGEFTNITAKLMNSHAPSVQDMLWTVTLQEPARPSEEGRYHTVMPIYNY